MGALVGRRMSRFEGHEQIYRRSSELAFIEKHRHDDAPIIRKRISISVYYTGFDNRILTVNGHSQPTNVNVKS